MKAFRDRSLARGKPAEYGQEIVKRRYRRTAEKVNLENKVVVDFGCGNGAQTYEFVNSGCGMIALDIEYEYLHEFLTLIHSQQRERVLVVQYGGDQLPIATSSVDLVLSYEVFEHVQDESRVLSEIHRILKPRGEMVLSVPNKWWIFETHGADLPLLPWNRVPFFSWLPRWIHERFARARNYRKSDIIKILQSCAFRVATTEYITAPLDVVKGSWLRRFLRTTIFPGDTTPIPFLSTSILVHCAKA